MLYDCDGGLGRSWPSLQSDGTDVGTDPKQVILHDIIFIHCCRAFLPLVLWQCWLNWWPLIVVEDLFVFTLVLSSGSDQLTRVNTRCPPPPPTLIHTKCSLGYAWSNQTWTCVSEKQCAFTLHLTLNLYAEKQKTTNTKKLYPAGKWIFWTSLKRLIAFIVSLCFAFIDC